MNIVLIRRLFSLFFVDSNGDKYYLIAVKSCIHTHCTCLDAFNYIILRWLFRSCRSFNTKRHYETTNINRWAIFDNEQYSQRETEIWVSKWRKLIYEIEQHCFIFQIISPIKISLIELCYLIWDEPILRSISYRV